nr:hypothetical protein SYMBAF_50004 [Serratia symbiotica]
MLIISNNGGIKRILSLISKKSLLLFKTKLSDIGGIIKTPFVIHLNNFSFICSFVDKNTVLVLAFRYSKPNFNFGEKSGAAEINVIENHFLDKNLRI